MTRFTEGGSLSAPDDTLERVKRLEEKLELLQRRLPQSFVEGRLRTDYTTAPASSTDVNATNQLYDVVILPTAEYILINNSGVLEWRTITLSTF